MCARSYKLGVGQSIGSSLAKKGFSNYSNYIGRYKPRVTTQNLLLQCYLELLNAQIQSECYFDALQTCEKIKFFNLHSMNPNDVLKSLESKGYKNFLPNTCFSNFEAKEQFKNIEVDAEFLNAIGVVARIWMEKCVIFKALDDKEMFQKWVEPHKDLPSPMLIIMDLMNLGTVDFDSVANPLVYTAIIFAECTPTRRQMYFEKVLFWFLKDDSSSVKARDWINESMKLYQMDLDKVLPLIQCFIKVLEKRQEPITYDFRKSNAMKPLELNKVPHDLRLPALYKMLEYRNSRMIMNHFQKLG